MLFWSGSKQAEIRKHLSLADATLPVNGFKESRYGDGGCRGGVRIASAAVG